MPRSTKYSDTHGSKHLRSNKMNEDDGSDVVILCVYIVCMYIYKLNAIYIYMYIYIYICIYIYIQYACVYIYIYKMRMYVYIYICTYFYICPYLYSISTSIECLKMPAKNINHRWSNDSQVANDDGDEGSESSWFRPEGDTHNSWLSKKSKDSKREIRF